MDIYDTIDFHADGQQLFVCRTHKDGNTAFEIIKWWNFGKDASINSIAWIKEADTDRPFLCAAGINPKHILILDIETGETARTLHGHGRSVNELVTSTALPHILASCSEDFTVRLWSLHPNRAEQPCITVFAGEGHRQPLLACSLHKNGRWLLTGAMDTAVGLWSIPETVSADALVSSKEEPQTVFHPHFFSNEVHHNYVDCVVFYGDLILSRCAKAQDERAKDNEILLWKIDGFHADDESPQEVAEAKAGSATRSAFPHHPLSQGFQRLMTFSMPNTDRFYLRFGLYHAPDHRPILCMGNQLSRFSFWDLQRLESDTFVSGTGHKKLHKGVAARKKKSAQSTDRLSVIASEASFSRSSSIQHGECTDNLPRTASLIVDVARTPSPSIADDSEKRSVLQDPMRLVEPHQTIVANSEVFPKHFATYTIAWSADGRWAVGVGDFGSMVMLYRDSVA